LEKYGLVPKGKSEAVPPGAISEEVWQFFSFAYMYDGSELKQFIDGNTLINDDKQLKFEQERRFRKENMLPNGQTHCGS